MAKVSAGRLEREVDEGAVEPDQAARQRVVELADHAAAQQPVAQRRRQRQGHDRGGRHDQRLGQGERAQQAPGLAA